VEWGSYMIVRDLINLKAKGYRNASECYESKQNISSETCFA
jgi:hypothetical protein